MLTFPSLLPFLSTDLPCKQGLHAPISIFVSISVKIRMTIQTDSNSISLCPFLSKKNMDSVAILLHNKPCCIMQRITIWLWKDISQSSLGRFWNAEMRCKRHGVRFVINTLISVENAFWVLKIQAWELGITSAYSQGYRCNSASSTVIVHTNHRRVLFSELTKI